MDYIKELEQRLAACASARIGAPMKFSHWHREKTGADRPVFHVPDHVKQLARELKLTIV